ncbi:MAG: DNA primase [Candidatus Staskawiczbacteria bacterium RIFOXYB2_FULL_32_9]|uniref:DNA primase n=1 Tax=Candidatus Staskawiczbacteria bacterium RIFOXYD1_FULL_32_13 TaxID=1802234 RepID=A0A1G2JQR4_9BACT|nr:MAG: primase protein [Parcubacteria group bacterium GW2011_GWC2_32_10]OGZ80558.1 MAG: DNA primase [Candidatus Staskawiczbacteria bacterium RIFOXYA2_FULL_32_7]OGZ80996.1 MAG: DNA primase [Candidatus Staskawiczbacteria bacterium RIFOXYB1_FULL_32_11]OGZ81270.1 MAG: DNA primase [Candidatus Staskawiczbacteria bacterium RIFOXYB2_FULL_32_9]OGZ85167.1 MAG: DNA primase [Candidatus Staskawiczbacteria bacterium RIFOXYC2_FULL_32_10]OGZ88588.1 MAG: DNA primase [Candidatus Staskawiczbacteria bacterium RI
MSDSQVEEIRNKLNVVDVVGSYIKLTKTGINYRGVCPFHKEKSPSFFVSPTRQMWHCFGCGLGHSIFDFVMKIEGIEFGDALRILAKKAGVELKRENIQLKTERQRLYEICDLSCSFFEKQLEASSIGKEAKEYLLKRGITEESIEKWRLGYSPDTWNSLSDYLVGKGYSRQEIVKAGLAVEKEGKNDSYDRFRGRIIFPIFDANSQVVGFGARVFKALNEKEVAKYINTPQTLLYDKSNILYGLHNAKLSARKNNQIVLTEGYTDTIMCHQAGFENTVATSGTALTQRHLEILKRYTDNLVLAFDMDTAGENATKRGIDLAEEKGFNIKVIETYGAKDPADIILENPLKWQEVIEKTKSIMDYYFDSAFLKNDKTKPEGKKEIAKIILPAIKRLQNKIEQSHWISKLAGKLQTSEDVILQELEKVKVVSVSQYQEQKQVLTEKNNLKEQVPTRKKLLEEKIMTLLAKCPENIDLVEDCHTCLFSENAKQFLENMKKIKNLDLIKSDTESSVESLNINKTFLDVIALKQEVEELENLKEEDKAEILLCLEHLKDLELKNKRESLSKAIRIAEIEDNHKEAEDLIKQFNELGK